MSAVKILLVEDDRSIAVSLVDGLTSAGHEVVHVTTGAAALELEATSMLSDSERRTLIRLLQKIYRDT